MNVVTKVLNNPLNGIIEIPADKSVSHRAIMFSALSKGIVNIKNVSKSLDCMATLNIIKNLGARYEFLDDKHLKIDASECFKMAEIPLDCGNSGTSMRLLSGILSGLSFESTLIGDISLSKRPMRRVIEPLTKMGAIIESNNGLCPLKFYPSKLCGIEYSSPIASAQVKSSILLAGLGAEGTTTVIESYKSRNHTELMLKYMGADIVEDGLRVSVRKSTVVPKDIEVVGDISSASFFMVAGTIIKDSDITIKNVGLNPTRCGIIDVLKSMGADIKILDKRTVSNEVVGDIRVRYTNNLKGIEIKGDIIPRLIDEIPIICVLALFADGETNIQDAGDLRNKESDRIKAVVSELRKIGADVEELDDGMIIRGNKKLNGDVEIETYHDHRLAMSLFVASLALDKPILIKDFEWVNTSFPEFLALMGNLGVDL